MNDNRITCLVILAGGQSRRMGRDKALVEFQGKRMIDHIVDRFRNQVGKMVLSAAQDYNTGLQHIPDRTGAIGGPVGAIFSLSQHFTENEPTTAGFVTVPVDAPFAPEDLVERLAEKPSCAIAGTNGQLQPVFAYWRCREVEAIRHSHDSGSKSLSLHWLARKCNAQVIEWNDDLGFANINTPGDLLAINDQK